MSLAARVCEEMTLSTAVFLKAVARSFHKVLQIDAGPFSLPQELLKPLIKFINMSVFKQERNRLKRIEKPCKTDHFKQVYPTKKR